MFKEGYNKRNTMKKIFATLLVFSLFVPSFVAFAQVGTSPNGGNSFFSPAGSDYGEGFQETSGPKDLKWLIGLFISLLNRIMPLIFTLALVVFLWGALKFVRTESDEERKTGREFMLWGIIGLFVMFSVWGLVNILVNTFSLDTSTTIPRIAPLNLGS